METKLYKNWWFLVLNGVIAILVGLLFLIYTKTLLTSIINAFGIIILVSGLVQLILSRWGLKKRVRVRYRTEIPPLSDSDPPLSIGLPQVLGLSLSYIT